MYLAFQGAGQNRKAFDLQMAINTLSEDLAPVLIFLQAAYGC